MTKKHVCIDCNKKCLTNCIYCEVCDSWLHFQCQGISKNEFSDWNELPLEYVCKSCRTNYDGTFDYLMGLERLKQASKQGMKKCVCSVQREQLFLKDLPPVDNTTVADCSLLEQDAVAQSILTQYHTSTKTALKSTGDGDCLFNSFSIALRGDETMSVELRYRCCIEMVTKREKITTLPAYKRLKLISEVYNKDCLDCAKSGSWSSVWRMIALSNILKMKVDSVYPCINSSKHIAYVELNTTFSPDIVETDRKITIMWTSVIYPGPNHFTKKSKKEWCPNHFVPLVDVPRNSRTPTPVRKAESPVHTTFAKKAMPQSSSLKAVHRIPGVDVSQTSYTQSSVEKTESVSQSPSIQAVHLGSEHKDSYSQKAFEQSDEYITVTKRSPAIAAPSEDTVVSPNIYDALNSFESENDLSYEKRMLSPIKECDSLLDNHSSFEYRSPTPTKNEATEDDVKSLSDTNKTSEEDSLVINDHDLEETSTDGPLNNKFMNITSTLTTLRGPCDVLAEIPTGTKHNTYFVIDNASNINKRSCGIRSEFWDDCGAWNKASTPKSLYKEKQGRLISIVKRNGVYCVEKWLQKRRVFVELDPQPVDTEILQVHRLYQTLKASPSGPHQFKRRITWLENIPVSMQELPDNVAIAEYIGIFPQRQQHGRVKFEDKNVVYIKTKEHVRDNLKQNLKHLPPKAVEKISNRETKNDLEKHRNLKQLKNMKHILEKASRPSSFAMNNAADHIVCVENMVQTHEFVKAVEHAKGMPPNVVLYTDYQINDIKRFCCKEGGTVLGFDKTFNLGEFHVTPSVYKNLSVIRRTTQEHPICFGPTFIHSNSSIETYAYFLHKIRVKLTDNEVSRLIIGSDDELALKSAIKQSFVGATHVLCTRHLRQNAKDYMENNVGMPKQDRQDILELIFGENGLNAAKDIDTKFVRLQRTKTSIQEKDSTGDKTFGQYFERRLLPLLEKHVIEPATAGKITSKWTNNNCESANHVLKSTMNWKQNAMPQFIEKLYEIIDSEQIEMCRSIRGMGNFKLHETYAHHYINIDMWGAMTEEERNTREKKFQTGKGRLKTNQSVSTDLTRIVLKTPSAGKKPNQVKRRRAERSRTPNAKRRLIE